MSKYSPLRDYLKNSGEQRVTLTFKEIETIIGDVLPKSAREYNPWWEWDKSHTQATGGWAAAGYTVSNVSLVDEVVTFIKINREAPHNDFGHTAKKTILVKNKFTEKDKTNFSKYYKLGVFLKNSGKTCVPLTFLEIEEILGFDLPPSAGDPRWWCEDHPHAQHGWINAGFEAKIEELRNMKITFLKNGMLDR